MIKHGTSGQSSLKIQQDKSFLEGWSDVIDHLTSTKNILRILQKKIAVPVVKEGKKNHIKYQSKRLSTDPSLRDSSIPTNQFNQSPTIFQIKSEGKIHSIQQNNDEIKQSGNSPTKRIRSEQPILVPLQSKKQVQVDNKINLTKSKLTFSINKNYSPFHKSIKVKQNLQKKHKTIEDLLIFKHHKISPLIKTKIQLLNFYKQNYKRCSSQLLQKNKHPCYCASEKKINYHEQQQKLRKQKKKKQQRITKSSPLYKIDQKIKYKTQFLGKLKQFKNNANDAIYFIDDHLQPEQNK